MKFTVAGADRDTGDAIEMTIDAADQTAAEDVAFRKGIMVSKVAPIARRVAPTLPQPAPTIEQGHHPGAPVVNVVPPRRGSSLGVASIVLGIMAFLICWIPLVNLLGVPLSALGLLLGLIGTLVSISRKGASIGYPIAGSAICALSLAAALTISGGLLRGAYNQAQEAAAAARAMDAQARGEVTPDDGTWLPADTAVRVDDVVVQIKRVSVGKIKLKDGIGGGGVSQDNLLKIDIEIANVSDTRKASYRTWGSHPFSLSITTEKARLRDNFQNRYALVNFGALNEVEGSIKTAESIYPGKSVQDVLVFEEPIDKAEYLDLELPGDHIGKTESIRFRIPASMIQRAP